RKSEKRTRREASGRRSARRQASQGSASTDHFVKLGSGIKSRFIPSLRAKGKETLSFSLPARVLVERRLARGRLCRCLREVHLTCRQYIVFRRTIALICMALAVMLSGQAYISLMDQVEHAHHHAHFANPLAGGVICATATTCGHHHDDHVQQASHHHDDGQ